MNIIRQLFATFVLAIALSGIASAGTITYDTVPSSLTLDSRFSGTNGETRTIGGYTYAVGTWKAAPSSTTVAAFARIDNATGVVDYSQFTIPTFNGATITSSQARGIAEDGTVVVSVGYQGKGARPVTFNVTNAASGTVISSGTGAGAISRGLWIDSSRFLMFYISGNQFGGFRQKYKRRNALELLLLS